MEDDYNTFDVLNMASEHSADATLSCAGCCADLQGSVLERAADWHEADSREASIVNATNRLCGSCWRLHHCPRG